MDINYTGGDKYKFEINVLPLEDVICIMSNFSNTHVIYLVFLHIGLRPYIND